MPSPANLSPLERRAPLSVQIAEAIRERIALGEWAVGGRIPGEHELAEALGASRNTVREAVRGLVHAGLLEPRPGDGTYVCASSELEVALQRRAADEAPADVFEVREALERLGARRAAEFATPEQLDRMAALLDERDAAADRAGYLALDLDFHLEVVRASGNRLLSDLFRDLHRDSTDAAGSLSESDWRRSTVEVWGEGDPHRGLLDALRRRDPGGAERSVACLISRASEFARAIGDRPPA